MNFERRVRMKKRTLLIIVSAAFLLVICLSVWFILQHKGNKRGFSKEELQYLKDAQTLEKLMPDKSSGAEMKLYKLSSRNDAVGYYAKVCIGDRYEKEGKDPDCFYRKALEQYDSKELRIKIADALAGRGQAAEAASFYASVLPDEEALKSMLKLNLAPDITGGLLIEKGRYLDSENFLKNILNKNIEGSQELKLEKLYAMALTGQGKYKAAFPVLDKVVSEDPDDTKMKWWYGRTLEVLGQTDKAKQIYISIGASGANRLGTILENQGNSQGAAAAYSESSDPAVLWRAAHLYDELGYKDKAIELYTRISSTDSIYKDDAAYREYVLKQRTAGSADNKIPDVLSGNFAWMLRLNKESKWSAPSYVSYSKPEFLKRVDAYKKSGRTQMADIELSIGEKNADLQGKLALGDWYLSHGDYYNAVKWGMKALKDKPNKRAYELAYMKPFEKQVKAAADEFKIDPDLLWALMREESYFDKDAVSKAGAIGLMQLMPGTGKYIASKLDAQVSEEDLMDPGINIRFGAYYLASLLKTFSGDADKALAAYNGGADNVRKWSRSSIGKAQEDFPTAIEYTETREYITKVMNSYCMYRKFYSN